ncbi:MAG: hypothetical protein IJ164_04280 [Duodenibacillus sp.]|nr:hypothetical protein [Duodenibacillus sp.]
MSVQSKLEAAIRLRHVVTFTYDGLPRTVEPFLLGVTTAGNPALRGYQTAGLSQSGKVPGWHLFLLHKIPEIAMTQEEFSGERAQYNPADRGMSSIGVHI